MIKSKHIRMVFVTTLLLFTLIQNKTMVEAANIESNDKLKKMDTSDNNMVEPIPYPEISYTKIELSQAEVSLVIGSPQQLVWQLVPVDAVDIVSFISDNEAVARVDNNGVVTGVRVGTATITVSLLNGEKSSCMVNVTSSVQSINVLYISQNSCSLAVKQSRTFHYKTVPENVSDTKMIWTSSDDEIASVDNNGTVIAKKVGNVLINMEADDGSGIKTSITVNVKNRGKSSKYSESDLTIVNDSKALYTYSDMMKDVKLLEEKYGDCIKVNILETTYDGRNIYEIVLGNPNAKKQVVVQASVHGREYMTTLLTMKQIELYCSNYYTGIYQNKYYSEAFDEVSFHIIPMANPDGVSISQFGAKGIDDKSLRTNLLKMYKLSGNGKKSYYTYWKANARGVDINRNFNSYWGKLDNGVNKPGAYFFKGLNVESEIETKALVKLVNQVEPECTISYHAMGSILYWNYGQQGLLKTKSYKLVSTVKKMTGYKLVTGFDKKNSAGFSDWVSIKKKIPAVTIEIGSIGCPLKISQFSSIWKKNKMMYVSIANLY